MLGGSFWVAFLRNTISATLMLAFFLMLDRPRFPIKKTICFYTVFGVLLIVSYSIWYLLDYDNFVRMASLSSLLIIGIFCSLMSGERIYLSLYKMAAGFYCFSVCTFCGVDVARWWFHGNLWVDIFIRFICLILILCFTWKRLRKMFLEGVDFLIEEMDVFSSVTLFVSVLIGAIVAYWPNLQGFSVFNMVRAFFTLFIAGVVQYIILYLYIHLGKEHQYCSEKELLELNEQLLRQQLELMRESERDTARIRHDMRHHILLMKEYIQKGELDNLMRYLDQYGEDIENGEEMPVCGNRAVNSILSAYARQAKSRDIHVTMNAQVTEEMMIRDIDWVAILANVFENAIHGCLRSENPVKEIQLVIVKKANKMIVQCCNTSSKDITFCEGVPVSHSGKGIGVSSIIKAASRYEGEADFAIKNGKFITRILLNLPRETAK